MNAVLNELIAVMAVKAAQETSLASLEDFIDIFLLSAGSLLGGKRIPVVALKVVDVQFFDNFELLVHAVVGHQALQSLELVINNGRRDRRVVLVVPLVRELRPHRNHQHLPGQHQKHNRNVGQIADEQPQDDIHHSICDHRAKGLRVDYVGNCADMDLIPAIKVRQQVVHDDVQADHKPVASAEKFISIHLV